MLFSVNMGRAYDIRHIILIRTIPSKTTHFFEIMQRTKDKNLGNNCIQIFHLGRYIVGCTVEKMIFYGDDYMDYITSINIHMLDHKKRNH